MRLFWADKKGLSRNTQRHSAESGRTFKAKSVVKTDFFSLGILGARWLKDLSIGGVVGSGKVTHLLEFGDLSGI